MPDRVNSHCSNLICAFRLPQASVPWTKLMSWPVRPPMPDTTLPALDAALVMALPAELVTRESPCCALPAYSDAPCLALFAVEDAASEVLDWARRCSIHRDCRSA